MCSNEYGVGEGARSRNCMVKTLLSEKIKNFKKRKNREKRKIGNLESCGSHVIGYIWLYFPENRIYFVSDALFCYFWVSYPPVV